MGFTMKQTVLIDIDDTIEYLCKAWVKWLNNKYNLSVDYNDITDWNICLFFPTLTKDQVFEPVHTEEFWETVEPMPDAMIYVKKLYDEGYDLYLCTSTDYRNIKAKYELIVKRYFPYIDWHHVIVANEKKLIRADFIIDDGVHNLLYRDGFKMLMTAPHNKDFDAKANGLERVYNWEQIYNTIHRFSDYSSGYLDAHSLIHTVRKWYWDENIQKGKDDPCVIDSMIDLFIRTIKKEAGI